MQSGGAFYCGSTNVVRPDTSLTATYGHLAISINIHPTAPDFDSLWSYWLAFFWKFQPKKGLLLLLYFKYELESLRHFQEPRAFSMMPLPGSSCFSYKQVLHFRLLPPASLETRRKAHKWLWYWFIVMSAIAGWDFIVVAVLFIYLFIFYFLEFSFTFFFFIIY